MPKHRRSRRWVTGLEPNSAFSKAAHFRSLSVAAPGGERAPSAPFRLRWALLSILLVMVAVSPAGFAQDTTSPVPERIGVYDSRAIAVAYVGSAGQVKKMKALTTQMKTARDAGDTNQMARLEAEGRAWQSTLHQQGFGTASVEGLLAEVAGDLPTIQQAVGVTRFVSKWDKAELARHAHAERVEVTMLLVDAFHPTEKQRQRALEIQKTRPQKNVR